MISRNELERLRVLRSDGGILSAYIKIDPRLMYDRNQAVAKFKGALKRFTRETNDERLIAVAEREKSRVLELLEGRQPNGRALAIFASDPAAIWEVFELDVILPTRLSVDATPDIALLAQVLDEYPRFAVAVVQKDQAEIYLSQQRSPSRQMALASDVPGRHDEGGWSQARYERHIEFHVDKHLKQVSGKLHEMSQARLFRRLAIGGSEEAVTQLLGMLSEPLSKTVIGTFGVDFKHETEEEVVARASEVLQEDERRSEIEMLQQAADGADAGGQGTIGIDDTLTALLEGRVRVLLLPEGVAKGGCECLQCGYLAAESFRRCPLCRGEADAVDVIERAVEKAYETGARVETLFGEARESLLARGGLGAVLRY